MNILVGCEESQTVTLELRLRGHSAYSNDIKQTSGSYPEWHLIMDVMEAIHIQQWDMIILHPPCTHMAYSGNRHYVNSEERHKAEQWTKKLIYSARTVCDKVAVEQPRSSLCTVIGQPTQIIHPWQFGHGEKKETWLWLWGLPLLKQTHRVTGREERIYNMNKKDRAVNRSKTYPGIAKAMAEQWTIPTWSQLTII